ncbi:regucalcin [Aedes albopictus]|uniref:SMP-30/Gluconolactonase/LRE-like region domain-containing protein n=1 Tax=Aedes albopictus TaxID=7160 RepID=A0ABM1ZFL1_AEDAL
MSLKQNLYIVLLLVTTASHVVLSTVYPYCVEMLPSPLTTVGEGPVWDVDRQSLYYVDIIESAILRYDPAENRTYRATVDGAPSVTMIIMIQGNPDHFILGTGNKLSLVQWDGFSEKASLVRIVVDLGESESHVRFNDGKVDSQGRLYAGTMLREGANSSTPMVGKLYRFDERSGQLVVQLSGVGISNGITWNEKLRKFYYVDSLALNIKEYDIAANGDLYNEQILLNFPN